MYVRITRTYTDAHTSIKLVYLMCFILYCVLYDKHSIEIFELATFMLVHIHLVNLLNIYLHVCYMLCVYALWYMRCFPLKYWGYLEICFMLCDISIHMFHTVLYMRYFPSKCWSYMGICWCVHIKLTCFYYFLHTVFYMRYFQSKC